MDSTSKAPGQKSNLKTVLLIVGLILVIVIGGTLIVDNMLLGNEKTAYDLVTQYKYNFPNPSTVRIVSGTVHSTKSAYLQLSYKDYDGNIVTGYYYLRDTRIEDLEKSDDVGTTGWQVDILWCEGEGIESIKFDVDKVNNALDKQ